MNKRSMMKNLAYGFVLIGALWMLTSCESVLFIELEESDKLIVVNGTLSNDSILSVQVSRTRHILDNAPLAPLDHAEVRLYREGSMIEELGYSGNGIFESRSFIPRIGDIYIIEAEHSGYPPVSARCNIPETVDIESVDTVTILQEYSGMGWSFSESYLQFDVTLLDPPDIENFYLLNMKGDRSYTQWRDTTVNYMDSIYHNGEWNYFVSDSTYTVGDIIRMAGYISITSSDLIVEAITHEGILFSDQLIDGTQYSIRAMTMSQSLASADSAVVDICLHSISESYYKYLKSRQKQYESIDDYLAVPVIVYSNVESGTGFLGGFSSDVYTITTFIPENQNDYWYYEFE